MTQGNNGINVAVDKNRQNTEFRSDPIPRS